MQNIVQSQENERELRELKRSLKAIEDDFDNFSFRIINPVEVENLTPGALAYLMNLRDSFSITEEAFEEILADVSTIFGILDVECIKDLLDYRGIGVKKIIN